MTPDHRDTVEQVNREHPDLLSANTLESCGRFTRLCAARLHARDPNWGLLTKNPGEAQFEGFALDAIIYRATDQVVDIIAGAHNPPHRGTPAWSLVPKRPTNHWAPPVGPIPPRPDPPPPDPPRPDPQTLEARLGALQAELEALRADSRAVRSEMQTLRGETQALRGEIEAFRTAWNREWRVTGGTSRDGFHAHQIDLVVNRGD